MLMYVPVLYNFYVQSHVMQQSRRLSVLTVVFVLNILHIQYFWLCFKIAEKETQIETKKAVMKMFIKLHFMKQTSKHNRLQFLFALMATYNLSC